MNEHMTEFCELEKIQCRRDFFTERSCHLASAPRKPVTGNACCHLFDYFLSNLPTYLLATPGLLC